jgi:hypothetical protein
MTQHKPDESNFALRDFLEARKEEDERIHTIENTRRSRTGKIEKESKKSSKRKRRDINSS